MNCDLLYEHSCVSRHLDHTIVIVPAACGRLFDLRRLPAVTAIWKPSLKDKSGAVIIVDYSRDYTFVNGVLYFISIFSFLIFETAYFNPLRSAK